MNAEETELYEQLDELAATLAEAEQQLRQIKDRVDALNGGAS